MWQLISNIASIATCVLFILYILGQIWKVLVTKATKYEKFNFIPFDDEEDIEQNDNFIKINDTGTKFSLSSTNGIRCVKIYKVKNVIDDKGILIQQAKTLVSTYKNLGVNETLYIQCDLGETVPTTQVEVRRIDFTKITFEIYSSGINGHILTSNYQFNLTFRGFLYYLCV
ncbi:MAG: hypothetical protein RR602_10875 [Longicatena sp.]